MTYRDLYNQLAGLSDDQLDQTVAAADTDGNTDEVSLLGAQAGLSDDYGDDQLYLFHD